MIGGKTKLALTKSAILERISEYDIFMMYMPNKNWSLNRVTFSPFRRETNPSFLVGNKFGNITFIDFADSSIKGDCFDFVRMMFNISNLDEILRKIDCDFGLGILTKEVKDYKSITSSYEKPILEKKQTIIQVVTKKFTNKELDYWQQYHLTIDDLKENNVYSIKNLYINKHTLHIPPQEMVFGYLYGEHWKIYRPFVSGKTKWFPNNVPNSTMDGLDKIKEKCNTLIITKSKKDYMVLKKVFPCTCSVQNEGISCFTDHNVSMIKNMSEKQILAFDSDVAGVANSQKITKTFGFDYINVPRNYLEEGIKDWSDWAKKYGLSVIQDYLTQKNVF